jgi:hypothetical protein
MPHAIYIFKTKEFVDSNQCIYKFGKTTKPNLETLGEQPAGTTLEQQIGCDNCHILEIKINSLFKVNYEPKKIDERGFFKGNPDSMWDDITLFHEIETETELLNKQIRAYRRKVVEIDEEIIEEIDVHTCCFTTKCFKGFTIYGCLSCCFSTTVRMKLSQHLTSEKHFFDSIPRKIDKKDLYKCGECHSRFRTQSGKWIHCRNAHTH